MQHSAPEYRPSPGERIVPRWALALFFLLTILTALIVARSAGQAGGALAATLALLEFPYEIPAAFSRELAAAHWMTATVLGAEIVVTFWLAGLWYWRVRRPLMARPRAVSERPLANESLHPTSARNSSM